MTASTITPAQTWLAFALPLLFASSVSPTLAATTDAAIDAAKREGEVVYYASMNLSEANALIGEFEKRHPYIKVKLQRSGSEKLLTRVLTEARAKKSFADVIQTVEFSMHIFKRGGLLARYIPQANSFYPKDFKEDGFWTTVYYNAYVTAYNTRLVPPRLLPKTYADLLDAKWKGKMMMEGTKAEWFAGLLQIMGQERGFKYMRDLAKQQPSPREGHELLAQLVAAGEGVMDINIPASSAERMKERGAPYRLDSFGCDARGNGGHRHIRPGGKSQRGQIVPGLRTLPRGTETGANPRTIRRPHRPCGGSVERDKRDQNGARQPGPGGKVR